MAGLRIESPLTSEQEELVNRIIGAAIEVSYKDIQISGQQLDLVVDRTVIVELKAVDQLSAIHQAQLLSYLKTTVSRLVCCLTLM
jgi:GxxExxY protein